MMQPLVSVIIPCYKQAQYLNDALQSVLEQTYENWECIIVNDGSPDNTDEVSMLSVKSDKRFKYIEIENGGVSNARNVGVKEAKGKYILPLDADDKIAPTYIELGLKEFDKDNTLKVVYCEAMFFGNENKYWNLPDFTFSELLKNNIIFCSALFKREDFVKIGGYDLNLNKGLEDWEFWINLLKEGGKVFRIPKVCFFYRIKEISRNVEVSENDIGIVFDYVSVKHSELYIRHFGSFPSLLEKNKKLEIENKRLIKAAKVSVVSVLKRLKKCFHE